MRYLSACTCAKVQLALSLPAPLEDYSPRACDCDFCTQRQVAYLSDPEAELRISGADQLESQTQGSEQALFWQCRHCQQLVVVTHEFESGLKGAVNINLFAHGYSLGKTVPASPKQLSAQQKRQRWQTLWLSVCFE